MDLTSKSILITGAGSGIGLDAVEQFTKLGAFVIACGRSVDKLERVKARFAKSDQAALIYSIISSAFFQASPLKL
jgi:short-subunit dehydrogenase involved in D-alanine esterification of teichoic acids